MGTRDWKQVWARVSGAGLLAVAGWSMAATPRPPPHPDAPPGPAFVYEYRAPESESLRKLYRHIRKADLFRQLPELQRLDGLFLLSRPLRFTTVECGELGAFYLPQSAEVQLCYETLAVVYERGRQLQHDFGYDDGFADRYTYANARFIVMHEAGHALIDLLDLPATGRQEDAVDQLATMLIWYFGRQVESPEQVAESLRMAANWFLTRSTGAYNLAAYADEHALGEQRYFSLQCLLYGSDPEQLGSIIEDGDLPPERARSCPAEADRVKRAWLRLLLPHLAPRYRMDEIEADRYFEQTARVEAPAAAVQ